MDAAPRAPEFAPEAARCQAHPDEPVLGLCARCGTFFCGLDRRGVDGADYCAPCAARPDVDYLEAYRLKHWGRRDLWTWLVGLSGVLNTVLGLLDILSGSTVERLLSLGTLLSGVVGLAFWWGIPSARLLLCFIPVMGMGMSLLVTGSALFILPLLLPLFITLGIYRDTRNKLFFKLEVPREAVRKLWHLHANNPIARSGFLLSLFGLAIPVFAPFGLVSSIIGLRRVDLTARPPVGRQGYAVAGIVLGGVGVLGWGGLLLLSLYVAKWGR